MENFHVYFAVSTIFYRKSGFVCKKRDFVVIYTAEFSLFLFILKEFEQAAAKSD